MPEVIPDSDAEPEADPDSVARAICLRLLTARARTHAELAEALRARAVPAETASRVLDRLSQVGLVDDAEYAERFVGSRQADRGLSRRELERQLRHRGVGDATARAALAGVDPEVELEAARKLVSRRLQATAKLPDGVRMRRLVGMLARRGYPPEMAYRVVRLALGEPCDGLEVSDTV